MADLQRFTSYHISGHPSAAGRAQDRESSPVKDQHSTTVSSRVVVSVRGRVRLSFYLNLRNHLIGLLSDRSSICGLCSCHKLTSDGAVWTGLRHARQVAVTVAMQSLVVERTGHDSGTVRRYGDLLYTPTLLTKFVARILLIYCQTSSLICSE